jgi:hypothetical protein
MKVINDLDKKQEQYNLKITDVLSSIVNSPSNVSSQILSFLHAEEESLIASQNHFNHVKKVINEYPYNAQRIRMELANQKAIEQTTHQLETIKRQEDEIKAREAKRQSEFNKVIQTQKERHEMIKAEQHVTGQCLEVFDYSIRKLNDMLHGLENDACANVSFNFPVYPTIYKSDLIYEGIITNGSNCISLGTNAGWQFNIAASQQSITTNHTGIFGRYGVYHPGGLKISCTSEIGESGVSIQPTESYSDYLAIESLGNRFYLPPETNLPDEIYYGLYVSSNLEAFDISVNITNRTVNTQRINFTNYKSGVDECLRMFINSQYDRFPLVSKTNVP